MRWLRILVVDPAPEQARRTREILERNFPGARVDFCQETQEALRRAKERSFHLILADHNPPQVDVLPLLSQLREGKSPPSLIAVFRESLSDGVSQARELGASECLVRGPEFDVVLPHVVRRVLEVASLEKQLEDWQHRYGELLQHVSDAVFFLDLKGRLIAWNRPGQELLGLSPEDLEGRSYGDFLSEASRQALLGRIRAARRRRFRLERFEAELLRPGGGSVPVEINAWPILRKGRVAGYQAYVKEIGEKKAALERERELRRQLQATVEALERKTIELEESQRLQSQFISNVSHEFRTPLNGIMGYAELLRDGFYGDVTQEQREVLRNIISCGQHLLELVNEILDLAKIQSHQLKLLLEPCTPRDVIEPVAGTIRPLVQEKGLELRIGPCEERPLILCDLQRVYQVLLNLAGNAVKFTERGYVELGAIPRDHYVEFYVKDTGSGIPKDKQEVIFRQFVQLDGSISRRQGGLGIGLSLSKQLVELHGGEIGVESQEGVGSRFYFTIPVYGEDLPGSVDGAGALLQVSDR
ncbi:MAG: ATP-binding protein [candidate division KSB1 bacterium]|nr:ATP-binding protein [candidate division KSB1 bacterium]